MHVHISYIILMILAQACRSWISSNYNEDHEATTHVWYLAKTKSCAHLYCYSPNSGLIDTHMRHVPHTYWAVHCQIFVCFDVWKLPIFLRMTNTDPNLLLSLGRVRCYTLLVICQIFTKCCMCVAACVMWLCSLVIMVHIFLRLLIIVAHAHPCQMISVHATCVSVYCSWSWCVPVGKLCLFCS